MSLAYLYMCKFGIGYIQTQPEIRWGMGGQARPIQHINEVMSFDDIIA